MSSQLLMATSVAAPPNSQQHQQHQQHEFKQAGGNQSETGGSSSASTRNEPSNGNDQQHQSGKPRVFRPREKLSVVIPNDQKSLVTPTFVADCASGQLLESIVSLGGQEAIGLFTGLPSCTPMSADALPVSSTLSAINPFFWNLSNLSAVSQSSTVPQFDSSGTAESKPSSVGLQSGASSNKKSTSDAAASESNCDKKRQDSPSYRFWISNENSFFGFALAQDQQNPRLSAIVDSNDKSEAQDLTSPNAQLPNVSQTHQATANSSHQQNQIAHETQQAATSSQLNAPPTTVSTNSQSDNYFMSAPKQISTNSDQVQSKLSQLERIQVSSVTANPSATTTLGYADQPNQQSQQQQQQRRHQQPQIPPVHLNSANSHPPLAHHSTSQADLSNLNHINLNLIQQNHQPRAHAVAPQQHQPTGLILLGSTQASGPRSLAEQMRQQQQQQQQQTFSAPSMLYHGNDGKQQLQTSNIYESSNLRPFYHIATLAPHSTSLDNSSVLAESQQVATNQLKLSSPLAKQYQVAQDQQKLVSYQEQAKRSAAGDQVARSSGHLSNALVDSQRTRIQASTGSSSNQKSALRKPNQPKASTKEADSSNNGENVVRKKSKGGRRKKQVTDEELMARKNRSKERNRVAAKRCRQKRKVFLNELHHKIDQLQEENEVLKNELDSLRQHHKMCRV